MIRRSGIRAGRNRIRRHMRHMNLISTRKKVHRKHVPGTIVARPNIMWETDITKIYIDNEGWMYLTAYLDLCSRKIKGYLVSRMSRTAELTEAVDNALLGTFQDLNVNGLRIRSDNGSQLTSSGYEKHLRTFGIKHETIHAHTPVRKTTLNHTSGDSRMTTYTQGNSSVLMTSGNTWNGLSQTTIQRDRIRH